ncbi:hypothetical protein ACTXT7_011344 [Hymenolepis weldensis]
MTKSAGQQVLNIEDIISLMSLEQKSLVLFSPELSKRKKLRLLLTSALSCLNPHFIHRFLGDIITSTIGAC